MVPFVNQLMLAAHTAQNQQELGEPLERACTLIQGCGNKLRRTPSGVALLCKCRTALTRHMSGSFCISRIRFLIQELLLNMDKWANTQPELRGPAPVRAPTPMVNRQTGSGSKSRPGLVAANPQKQLKIQSPRVFASPRVQNAAAASALRRSGSSGGNSSGSKTGKSPRVQNAAAASALRRSSSSSGGKTSASDASAGKKMWGDSDSSSSDSSGSDSDDSESDSDDEAFLRLGGFKV